MERIKLNELKEWFNRKNRKPLIVFGARQVEKTYLIKKMFLEKELKDHIYIDLKRDDDARRAFENTGDPKNI